jgi:hypothetical protein
LHYIVCKQCYLALMTHLLWTTFLLYAHIVYKYGLTWLSKTNKSTIIDAANGNYNFFN